MEWLPQRKYYQPSADGRYTVSATRLPDRIAYTAWRRQEPIAKQLGNAETAEACRKLCETDAKRLVGQSDHGAEQNLSVPMAEAG